MPGNVDDDRGVQRADVDAELERVGRDDRVQLAAHEPRLELAALLRRVAGAVRARRARRARGRACRGTIFVTSSTPLRDLMKQIVRAPLAHERGEHRRRLAERRARASAERLVLQRRVPHRDLARGARGAVAVDERDLVQPGQPLGELDRVGDRRAGAAGSAARCRTRRRSAAAAAGRWRRASRTRRGTRAPRRRRRPRGSRTSRPTRGGWGGSRRGACRGS